MEWETQRVGGSLVGLVQLDVASIGSTGQLIRYLACPHLPLTHVVNSGMSDSEPLGVRDRQKLDIFLALAY